MKIKHISWLRCPDCGGELSLLAGTPDDGQIENGVLSCQQCKRPHPIFDGVAVLFSRNSGHALNQKEIEILTSLGFAADDFSCSREDSGGDKQRQIAVLKNWEYQWDEIHPFTISDLEGKGFLSQEAFQNFIPVDPAKVVGSVVLVGGAGRGREVYHLSKMGAQTIVAIELGREIHAARQLLQSCSSAELLLIRSDLVEIPLKQDLVDIAICDHALQHVHDHRRAFRELARVTRTGGQTAICVYSWEGNFIMTHLVEPAKAILHRIPLKLLFMLSFFPTFLLQCIIMLFYLPLARNAESMAKKLPLYEHMLLWSQNRFKMTWMSIFDLFHAPISYHFRRDEVVRLAEENKLSISELRHTNSVLWSLVATKQPLKN